jgi:hypothetical protein
MVRPGLEPGTFCVLDRCDNQLRHRTFNHAVNQANMIVQAEAGSQTCVRTCCGVVGLWGRTSATDPRQKSQKKSHKITGVAGNDTGMMLLGSDSFFHSILQEMSMRRLGLGASTTGNLNDETFRIG